MASIRIEDLPTVEDLTAEELEEIFGAGRFSFKPAFESLGAREMMDAGLGGVLMSNVARMPDTGAPVAEHVRGLDSATMSEAIDVRGNPRGQTVALTQGAQPNFGSAQQDADFVKNAVERIIRGKLIPQLQSMSNGQVVDSKAFVQSENDIRLDFKIRYDTWAANGLTVRYGTISIHAVPGWYGDTKVYNLRDHSHGNFEHSSYFTWQDVRGSLDRICASEQVRTNTTFDRQKFAESIARQAGGKFGTGPYKVKDIEAIDGGIRIVLEIGERIESDDPQRVWGKDHRYTDCYALDFKFNTADLKAGTVTLERAEKFSDKAWRNSATHRDYPWNNDGRVVLNWSAGEQEALKGVRWTPTIQ